VLVEIKRLTEAKSDPTVLAKEICDKLKALLSLPVLEDKYPELKKKKYSSPLEYLRSKFTTTPDADGMTGADLVTWNTMLIWLFLHLLGKISSAESYAVTSRAWIDEFLFSKIVSAVMKEFYLDDYSIQRQLSLVKILTSLQVGTNLNERLNQRTSRSSEQFT
jgi:hypothetical protein